MKKILLLLSFFWASFANAQENTAVPDQNPNYLISQAKYTGNMDSLQANMNTTVQQTYKAYDWYIAKQERKAERIADRRERRLYRLQNSGYYYNPGNQFYDPYADPYRFSPNRFRHRGWRNIW